MEYKNISTSFPILRIHHALRTVVVHRIVLHVHRIVADRRIVLAVLRTAVVLRIYPVVVPTVLLVVLGIHRGLKWEICFRDSDASTHFQIVLLADHRIVHHVHRTAADRRILRILRIGK
ncbi:hypothetical protein GCK72_021762 [Caenorhabditis remanei]|uniref:Uncharacterized protein n=1 Tax=Caenorhabditis remanei TaxID=31234 RepID=A0A6A5GKN2_CAERE|nr:hypothetical protein GCK72_021762 [Caenorhabditis remanei]KAF1755193.1 hypothetical protein GCK72_021762 [Caenorhabditis remanei]